MACTVYKFPTNANNETSHGNNEEKSWKPFLRQLFVSSVIWAQFFAVGLCIGTPTVFVPQMRKMANSTDAVSVEMASWLSSTSGYSSIPMVLLLAFLMPYVGRKGGCIIVSFSMISVSVGYYITTNPVHLLITDVLQGITNAGTFTVSIIAIVEYTSPKYRGVILTIKTASLFWAVWIANAIESPAWLASKGRIDECRNVHMWLKGCSEDSERELQKLIASYEKMQNPKFFGALTDKQFYTPVLLASIVMATHQLSGKQVYIIYAIDILKKITNSESTAYTGMLILDGVTVLCMYVGCALSKVLNRRTLLFSFGGVASAFLFVLSLYLYLCRLAFFVENDYISMCLLVGFSAAIGARPIILAMSLYGELIPAKYNRQTVIITPVIFSVLQATLLKISPAMFNAFNMHGTFLFYAVSSSVCLMILYKYLPETKDKTMQEIEEYFK